MQRAPTSPASGLLEVPAFKAHLRVEPLPPQDVLLDGGGARVRLRGHLYFELARLIDGRRTVDQLIQVLTRRHTAAEVHYALEQLVTRGFLIEAEPEVPAGLAAHWHAQGVSARVAAAALKASALEVRALGDVPARLVREALRVEGLRTTRRGAALTLVLVEDYLQAPLEALNREALRTGTPWVLARPTGTVAWLGPRFVPGTTACWECLAQRLRANLPPPMPGRTRTARGGEPEGPLRAMAHLLASALGRLFVTGDDGLAGTLVALDSTRLRAEHHVVVRRPQCPTCGAPGLVAAGQRRPLRLQPRPKAFTSDGGHRALGPEAMLARYQHHVSPVTGVVHLLEPLPGVEDERLPVINAGLNRARRVAPDALLDTARALSTGKGATLPQAKASALGEALERYCGVFQGDEARRRAPLRALDGAAVEPRQLLLFSERQYREREAWNAARPRHEHVPQPFDASLRIDWTPVWSLTHEARRYVPTAYCYYGYPEADAPFCGADSNGCAAGTSLEEAILQGFLELVERDAVSLWWYNRARRPRVALEGFGDPLLEQLADAYHHLGRELHVLDLTTDLGIPAFAAVSRRTRGPERLCVGFGAHLEARLGVQRAITEMNQFLPLAGRDLRAGPSVDEQLTRWLEESTLENQPHLAPADVPALEARAYPDVATSDLRDDVRACVERARRRGLETLVLDQTRPDVGLRVVRVIVPGLRHLWPRFGPGRLYDVPVKLGWLPRPTPEERLNPLGVFF
ncbi:TOMM precursor leader peptide-binding protein [Archangium violaceum]|uniref:TOMM precursor leader peptide-binding protein n=1 Tax=Archangium violaceum TaxID=83451 RepID=UPI0019518299|nr:TOMM precursor leader peptide-binding protein [Archangium violaceum]QRO00157.1 TOMM precursor leader peptide-binding protein [Archangium violaceum]